MLPCIVTIDVNCCRLRIGLIASYLQNDLPGRVDGHEVELPVHSSSAREVRRRRTRDQIGGLQVLMQTGGLQFAKSMKHGADLAAEME